MIGKLNTDILYLIEALKVEGYWSLKHMEGAIQNKDLALLRYIERILKDLNIRSKKRILVKIRDNDFRKISIINENEKEIRFWWEKSPLSNKQKIVFNLPFKLKQKIILTNNNTETIVSIYVKNNEIIVSGNNINGWAYLDIRFHNIKFIRFLESVADKKNLSINFNTIRDKEDITAIFGAIVDAEANIAHYRLFRRISIRMKSEKYLEDIKKMLSLLDVNSKIYKFRNKPLNCDFFRLDVEGWEDFNKLIVAGMNFKHSRKKAKMNEIMKSYKRNQISRNSALRFYLNLINNNRGLTAWELSNKISKSRNVINHYLNKLIEKGLISRVRKKGVNEITYLYYPNNSRKHSPHLTFHKD